MNRDCFSLLLILVIMLGSASNSAAQGIIYGTVQNSDLSYPGSDDLTWFGFLDNTDEEIRIEANAGAGYDGLNWFDDFQNYTTEAAGNPYDFVYINVTGNEAFRLSGTIPANSFQEENVVLLPGTVPARPTNLSAHVISPAQINLSWDGVPALTYHVYRRISSNNGVYRRIDDPNGNLASPGAAGSTYSDMTSDGVSEYVYLLIAEDGEGRYSAHSEPLMVDASGASCACPCYADLNCDGLRDVIDMNALIDILFFSAPDQQDSTCPRSRADIDCDGFSNAVDLNSMIDILFFSAALPCDPCGQ